MSRRGFARRRWKGVYDVAKNFEHSGKRLAAGVLDRRDAQMRLVSHVDRPEIRAPTRWSVSMSRFDVYRTKFPNARLTRSKTGVLQVALHTDDGTLVFNGDTHELFVDLFHAIGSDHDNRAVILTGSGDAFMETISPEGFDFFTPQGYDKIYREGRKVLMNILDIESPLSAGDPRIAQPCGQSCLRSRRACARRDARCCCDCVWPRGARCTPAC